MKLEVGMYAYSKKCRAYGIGKIVNITENGLGFKGDLIDIQYRHSKHAIENHDVIASYNIIDILEVGDYANGVEVITIYEKGDSFTGNRDYIFKEKTIEVCNDNYELIPFEALFTNNEIESILTKEQFEQMAYKVGE